MFNREEYARQCRKVSSTPLYRATCPPEDELAGLRENAVDEIADDILDEYMADPALIAEMLLENDYDYKPLQEMCKTTSAMIESDISKMSTDSKLEMADAMIEFLEEKALSLAEEQVDD